VSSKLIQEVTKGGKTVAVEYVDRTTSWVRPGGFPSHTMKSAFTAVVTENFDQLNTQTSKVAMKYVPMNLLI
jgi:hypothetical protein